MNSELQKSLQVSVLPGSLDSYMLIILLIMVAAGILGGVANCYLGERQAESGRREWGKYLTLGVIVALTVPLFLNMISSNLLEAPRTRPVEFFVFGGFCLIYVVSSRRLVENMTNRLFGQMEQMKRDLGQIRERQTESTQTAVREEPSEGNGATPARPDPAKESLSYNDIEILRALAKDNYVYGNLAGITDETGLTREVVSNRLTVLKNLGIIETRISEKNVLHWCVSPKGKQALGEILAGHKGSEE